MKSRKRKKKCSTRMDYESIKINNIKKRKKLNVLQFFSLPNTKWCFIFRLGKLSYANLFYSYSESCLL
uniref:Uncharacterized protein n=1 Tax=Takifugu rubripes TaxID=31033 RepID=A0A674MN50_TAKRU